ncbi:hypothetical protein FPF71_09375 [Algibacter amylolyticus]|uniref:Uncharacterized protein n=1 Tax=Algibacter amylolyticus TaxID=1608400 RepID=A0A5M7B479_9FLAO|nr:hypothetical protein [Algibacter amylolyticus]KAA5824383.1 hypothetical protein F2B50_09375 [Algibacter amylolyticus]MBB5269560.1 hypothetical protein [Algibacter amylolyticus]TSJ75156.1 hypothetical protein FPF71_09375 [Algibacter amylolyticus]
MLKFTKGKLPELEFKKAVKKPIPVNCIQIKEPFEVETMEGIMKGKKNDWLMIGIHGEMYPCDNSIFKETYDLL